MFLATHDIITSKLKSTLEEIEGFDELLADIIQQCVHFYEFKLYVLPKEKHLLLKVCEIITILNLFLRGQITFINVITWIIKIVNLRASKDITRNFVQMIII